MQFEDKMCSIADSCLSGFSNPSSETIRIDDHTLKVPVEILTKQEVLMVIAKYFQSKDFVIESYTLRECRTQQPLPRKDEYLTLEVTVTSLREARKNYLFFVKKLPDEPVNCYEKAMKARAFYKETELYLTLFSDFERSQNGPWRHWSPVCYLSKPGQVLVLEDLVDQGFYQVGRRDCLDREQILAVMRCLAALHSASIKFEEKVNSGALKPKIRKFDRTSNTITVADVYAHLNFETESIKLKCHPGNVFLEAGIKSQVNLVDHLPGYSRAEIEKIKKQLPDLMRSTFSMVKPSTKYRNVFIHGDLCTNNIFFRKTDGNLEALLIDYQMVRYAPPALDLIMLLYLNQRRDFRLKEMQAMLQCYYNMFSEELAKNGICIQKVLPVKDFLDSCQDYMEWVSLSTVMYFQTYLLSDDIIKKYLSEPNSYNRNMMIDRSEMVSECFFKDAIYHTRMTEAMNDLVKQCINFK